MLVMDVIKKVTRHFSEKPFDTFDLEKEIRKEAMRNPIRHGWAPDYAIPMDEIRIKAEKYDLLAQKFLELEHDHHEWRNYCVNRIMELQEELEATKDKLAVLKKVAQQQERKP